VNRSRQHEQATVARFFEEHYGAVMELSSAMYERGALTDEELRHLNWIIGTSTMGSTHQLTDVAPTLAKGAHRLKTGERPAAKEVAETTE
jgi:hypothetical protein